MRRTAYIRRTSFRGVLAAVSAVALTVGGVLLVPSAAFAANTASISGFVYSDLNDNGVKDVAEPGLSGVSVTITGTDSTTHIVDITVQTLADGSYTFPSLAPSDASGYTVTESAPTGYLPGTDSVGTPGGALSGKAITGIVLAGGVVGTDNNFAELQPASLSGSVYADSNDDGVKQGGEPGIVGTTVQLTGTDDQGSAVDIHVSSQADGSYTFPGLRPSDSSGYTVTETQPQGFGDGDDTLGDGGGVVGNDVFSGVVLGSGDAATGYLFGELQASSISGYAYIDANDNGTKDSGEAGIAGVTVILIGADIAGDVVNVSTTTAGDGSFTLTNLSPSSASGYTVLETQPAGYLDGRDAVGTAGGTLGNDTASAIVLGSGAAATGYDFGELQVASISGSVYLDSNDNGIEESTESGIAGTSVTLTGINDLGSAVNLTTTTAADGSYAFTNLRPAGTGGYTVTETQPAGYLDGKSTVGSDGGTGGNGQFVSVQLPSGSAASNYNFGEVQPALIHGGVYIDEDQDGIYGSGDPAASGSTLTLTGLDDLGNSVDLTTSPAPDGDYAFSNVRPSSGVGYTVTVTRPAGTHAGITKAFGGGSPQPNAVVGIPVVSGEDDGNYFAQLPTGVLAVIPSAQTEETLAAPGPDVLTGDPVTVQFTLTNTFASALTNVSVTNASTTITCPSTTIAALTSMTCEADLTAASGIDTLTATVDAVASSGPVGGNYIAYFTGVTPQATLLSTVDGSDSTVSPGPTVAAGAPIVVTLKNSGDVPLSFDSLSAGALGITCPSDLLSVGASENCTATVAASRTTTALTAIARFFSPNLIATDGTVVQYSLLAINFIDFVVRPAVTALSPDSGGAAGGATVQISGSGFTGATTVLFGSTAATILSVTPTLITVVAPAGSGVVDVSVIAGGQTSATSAVDRYTYLDRPVITGVLFPAGGTAGGEFVTITGTGFTGATALTFGAMPVTDWGVSNATTITAVAPPGLGVVDVIVTTPGGSSAISVADEFTHFEPPTITSISPSAGPTAGGTAVTITGTGFDGVSVVFLGANQVGWVENSPTSITATTNAGSGTLNFKVGGYGGDSALNAADQFTFVNAPTITSIVPTTGSTMGGTTVSITGTNLLGATAIDFGLATSTDFVVNSPTSATAISPAGSGTVDVTATTPGGTSSTSAVDQFTYVAPATITTISPANGAVTGGTVVTITGTNFTGATAVTFGGVDAKSFTVNSATSITATTPPGTVGTADVVITTIAGLSTAGTFVFTATGSLPLTGSSSPLPGLLDGLFLVLIGGAVILVRRFSRRVRLSR
ncbi:MAG TPA: SdrD B-like domain-containing protein [Galbitalea sp.]|nr:SdrD B-like domain-containing protein [Galbitalea sp.]